MLNFVKNIGPTEIIVLVAILILFFGSKIAVRIGRAGGETLKEIKKIKNEFAGTIKEVDGGGKQKAASK